MTANSQVLDQLMSLIAEVFMVDAKRVNASTTAADVPGWDSVSQVMLVMRIEDVFGITIGSDEMSQASGVGALAELVTARQSG